MKAGVIVRLGEAIDALGRSGEGHTMARLARPDVSVMATSFLGFLCQQKPRSVGDEPPLDSCKMPLEVSHSVSAALAGFSLSLKVGAPTRV